LNVCLPKPAAPSLETALDETTPCEVEGYRRGVETVAALLAADPAVEIPGTTPRTRCEEVAAAAISVLLHKVRNLPQKPASALAASSLAADAGLAF